MLSIGIDELEISKPWIDVSEMHAEFAPTPYNPDMIEDSFSNVVAEIKTIDVAELTKLYADNLKTRMSLAASKGLKPSGQAKLLVKALTSVKCKVAMEQTNLPADRYAAFNRWISNAIAECNVRIINH